MPRSRCGYRPAGAGTARQSRRPRCGVVAGFPRALVLLFVVVLTTAIPGAAFSAPAQPPNPDPQRIREERAEVRHAADRVRVLARRLDDVESELAGLSAVVGRSLERVNKARIDLRRAERAGRAAERAARAATAASEAADRRLVRSRDRMDDFIEGSYKQGSVLGSIPAFVGADDAGDALDRASLLRVLARSQLDVLDELRAARVTKANQDAAAREAALEAERKRRAAERARVEAETARRKAVSARESRREEVAQLRAERESARRRLTAARAEVETLLAQRDRHRRWLEADRDEPRPPVPAGDSRSPDRAETGSAASSAVETVVSRALSQRGVTYAWGGGDADGATRGIRDGGVADAHGDYRKIGFDCSGLMVYAFAGIGIRLPHYSGYQYRAGERVPLARKQRGDMLFWNDGGGVHHVALYLGDGRMVEAPYSGARVRVTEVRYAGIAPYAVRLL